MSAVLLLTHLIDCIAKTDDMVKQQESKSPIAAHFTPTIHHDTYDYIKNLKGDFKSRRVLITGASKGLGQEMAVAFATAGYSQIALLARTSLDATIRRATEGAIQSGHEKPHFLPLTTDILSVESVNAAAAKVELDFGSLDILINNAGYLETWKPIVEADPTEWWRSWEVNVRGSFLMSRAFIPLLLKGNEKTLIAVSSAAAWLDHAGASAYEGSKLAQLNLNSHIMSEYGDQGLVAYAIHPGGVKTDLALHMPDYMRSYLVDEPGLAASVLVWLTQERRSWLVYHSLIKNV